MARLVASALLALVLVGGVSVPILPCLASGRLAFAVSLVYAGGSLICHQRPERSWTSCGRQWPVCGRCAGLYLGAAGGVVLAAAGIGWRGERRQWRARLIAAALPTIVSWAGEMAGLGDPGTPLRFLLAVPLGIATALWLSAVARGHLE